MLKVPVHPDKSFACSSDVLVAALEFEHVSVFALGNLDFYALLSGNFADSIA